ncbi:MAG: 2-oxoglutarate dehydrogenase E1 component [Deltaproteobacteria bacterium]|nr:2-oxoglutarate dehydrogenase E1 component [Deltaproteobacteria bacterium]
MDAELPELDSRSIGFAEKLYADFLGDPQSVPPGWRRYFESLGGDEHAVAPRRAPSFRPRGLFSRVNGPDGGIPHDAANLQDRIDQLIRAFRVRGHLVAGLDPLGIPRPDQVELDPAFYDLDASHMDQVFSTRTIHPHESLTLREILDHMRNTYCRSIGVQFMHMDSLPVKTWLLERMEGSENRLELTPGEQLRILTRLTDAVIFEDFVQKKYLGAKSFSLEGAESLIPLLDLAIEKAGDQHIDEIVIGMPHRGRLNVLANIMGKGPRLIFQEFEDSEPDMFRGHGDVKYHLGYSTTWRTSTGYDVHLSLCFNPSHLEYVNTVALGRMRAKQDRVGDEDRKRGMVLLIHGDAAFAGEGIVQETLNMSQLPGYTTGGTLHVVVNNQLGFTTSPRDGRSSTYATDVAKMLQVPIFHVNGEDPEAVAQVVRLAMDFRLKYRRDVVIDMYCYRRRGHNEGDEPAFTQPLMYAAIRKRKSVREGYLDHLLKLGDVTREQADEIAVRRRQQFDAELKAARREKRAAPPAFAGVWAGFLGGPEKDVAEPDTGVDRGLLKSTLTALARVPDDFRPHPKIRRFLDQRIEMSKEARALDWSAGESLAIATLAAQGVPIRLTGQDTERGTFSHRHAVLHDVKDDRTFTPLQHVMAGQAPVEIRNSPLNESGALGFEYGYSLDRPGGLVIWEAQFGDFVNTAQVIIDQFISSAEIKWHRLSGLVMLLPHGLEGQGPEHSSARIERFLNMCVDDNMQVAIPTTPAQLFHLLRRQSLRQWRKPLVVFTPKSLLRHPECVSDLDDLATGRFHRILPDTAADAGKIKRVLMCSGKVYYDLASYRREKGRDDVAILRIEQLYPLPEEAIRQSLEPYGTDVPLIYVQEEPENMGAWWHLQSRIRGRPSTGRPVSAVTRKASPSPATGSHSSHVAEQMEIVKQAFGGRH